MASIYLRGNVWQIKFTRHGRVHRRSLKTKNKRTAERLRRQLETTLANERENVAGAEFTLDWLLELVESYGRGNLSTNSLYQRIHALRTLKDTLAIEQMEAITVRDVDEFRELQSLAGVAPRTINDRVKLIRICYNYARAHAGYPGPNPFADVRKLPEKSEAPAWIESPTKRQHLIDTATADSLNALAFVALCMLAGMRKREAINAKWSWFNWEANLIRIPSAEEFQTKSRRYRTVPIADTLRELLHPHRRFGRQYVIAPDSSSAGFYRYDIRKTFERVAVAAKLSWITPKTLRHTFASVLVSNGVELYKVQKWLGHADPRTTQVYAHLRAYDAEINRIDL